MSYETRYLANKILHYFTEYLNVIKATKYAILNAIQNQMNDNSIKMEDIERALSDLEDKKLIKNPDVDDYKISDKIK